MNISFPDVLSTDSGVYRIDINAEYFYVGSSINLRKRFFRWKFNFLHFLPKNKNILKVVTQNSDIVISVIEYCNRDNTKLIEDKYLGLHKENPYLLNRCPSAMSNKGFKMFPEEKIAMSLRQPGKSVVVLKKDLTEVGRYRSIGEAAASIGKKYRQIRNAFNPGKRSSFGFLFRFLDESNNIIEPQPIIKRVSVLKRKPTTEKTKEKLRKAWAYKKENGLIPIPKTAKKICKYTIEGVLIENYSSITDAAIKNGVSRTDLKKRIKGNGVYKNFMYKTETN